MNDDLVISKSATRRVAKSILAPARCISLGVLFASASADAHEDGNSHPWHAVTSHASGRSRLPVPGVIRPPRRGGIDLGTDHADHRVPPHPTVGAIVPRQPDSNNNQGHHGM